MEPQVAEIRCEILDDYLERSLAEYREADAACRPPRSWAILTGRVERDVIRLCQVHYGTNVRTADDTISRRFGGIYTDLRRAFWCDSRDILRVMKEVRDSDEEVLGSIHLHTDIFKKLRYSEATRNTPPVDAEHGGLEGCGSPKNPTSMSERPTPMDQEVYQSTSWPLNMIAYIGRADEALQCLLAAWRPDPAPGAACSPMPIRLQKGRRVEGAVLHPVVAPDCLLG